MAIRYGDRSRVSTPVSGWLNRQTPFWVPKPIAAKASRVTVTANSSAHTKGAWIQIVASTSAATNLVEVMIDSIQTAGVNTSTLVDIGVGASGSEVVVIENVAVGGAQSYLGGGSDNGLCFAVPVHIPSGSRVAARIQSVVTGGKTGAATVRLSATTNPALTSSTCTTFGSSTATSAGTAMSASSGTYTELIAATAERYDALCFIPSNSGTDITQVVRVFGIAIGEAGSEQLIGILEATTTSAEGCSLISGPRQTLFFGDFPAGSRISATMLENASASINLCGVGVTSVRV